MYVTLTVNPTDPNNSFHNNHYDLPVETSPSDHGKRFRNNGCKVEKGELCEHLGQISVTIGGRHHRRLPCPDGNCRVWIGPG